MLDPVAVVALVLWGAVVGMDLVSFPQGMLSRPIVAATAAGAIMGDLEAGLRAGVVLELFALDVLPVGAARYPDYGPGAVVAGAMAAGLDWRDVLGPAVLLGLLLAHLGGLAMEELRRRNGLRVTRAEAALAAGDAPVLGRLHRLGLLSDAVRGLTLTVLGLSAVAFSGSLTDRLPTVGPSLTLVVIAGGLVAGASGVSRRAGRGVYRTWAAVGLGAGVVIAWLSA